MIRDLHNQARYHMDHGYRFPFWSLKMLSVLGMAFASTLLVLFLFKLPYENVFTSRWSAGKLAILGSSPPESNAKLQGRDHPSPVRNHNSTQHPAMALPPVFTPASPTKLEAASPAMALAAELGKDKMRLQDSTSQGMSETVHTVVSISQMNKLLQQRHTWPSSSPPSVLSAVDEELTQAKSQMANVPLVDSGSGIYTPMYRNVSTFMRSYDLMEKMLKVYIYKEGDKPIFHESILEGIYASEGWFLKLLEANSQFVTEDPAKAHLFYLPFSSRLLQLTLYKRHSHNRDNLVQYMKDYVKMLIQKYPFWNRTNGQDHFLAACHDWAPAETRGRMLSSIRALCNADIKAGFVIGKDVSLPTVYVRSAKDPLQDIGGEPSSKRTILAFFAGYMHGNVRPLLLKHWGKDTKMRILDRLPIVKGNKNYIKYMKSSKYCICARGYAVHSPRVVEAILYECVPVIISDNYVPPFFEVLNWESFAVFVMEDDIPDLKRILMSITEEKYAEMQRGVREVQKHFIWNAEPVKFDMFHMILHSVWYNRVFQTTSV